MESVGKPVKQTRHINRHKLVKEESATKNNRKFSGIKTTHESKMVLKVKKQIKNVIYRPRIPQSCLFVHLIFVSFETGLIKWKTLTNMYICIFMYAYIFTYIFIFMFLNVLRNLKDSPDILHKCLDITVVVIKPKNVLGLPLLWAFLDVFVPFCSLFLE